MKVTFASHHPDRCACVCVCKYEPHSGAPVAVQQPPTVRKHIRLQNAHLLSCVHLPVCLQKPISALTQTAIPPHCHRQSRARCSRHAVTQWPPRDHDDENNNKIDDDKLRAWPLWPAVSRLTCKVRCQRIRNNNTVSSTSSKLSFVNINRTSMATGRSPGQMVLNACRRISSQAALS